MTIEAGDANTRLTAFVEYAARMKGDEKGEAQVFLDRLFQGLGWPGCKEAGAELEARIHAGGKTKFADLLWRDRRVLVEMKKRGEQLEKHRQQAFDYWVDLVPQRPRYILLCNFDELWIYDFDLQVREPLDRVPIADLARRASALSFMLPQPEKPLFANNRVEVTKVAAGHVAALFTALVARGEEPERAQRFALQCVLALFAEDIGLLPDGMFTRIVNDCRDGHSTYDLLGGLFRQMNTATPARGGRYVKVPYFNGGLFATIDPIDLQPAELQHLASACGEDWGRVEPAIFGSIYQSSLDAGERHRRGAHYTSEADIQRVVAPTIVRPWMEKVERAGTLRELLLLRKELSGYRVLDPACGSGNFLYIAFRELKRIEMAIIGRIRERFPSQPLDFVSAVRPTQLFGFDVLPFAVELAKVTLLLAKELALIEAKTTLLRRDGQLPFDLDPALPLDNLDANIQLADALHTPWPAVSAIIGNPPFQSKNKMQKELGRGAIDALRDAFPDVPGRADYCVYFLRKAHDHLPAGGRAGLVGTNTIRQNYSREGGLDHVLAMGGTITEAVSTQDWSGDAAVHVSIVNWTKGEAKGPFRLSRQGEDGTWEAWELDRIPASLSADIDVTSAVALRTNAASGTCLQGQTHGHEGFLLGPEDVGRILADPTSASAVHPYLTGDDMLTSVGGYPTRWVIDLSACDDLYAAAAHHAAFARVRDLVRDDILRAAEAERSTTGKDKGPRQSHASRWWRLWRGRAELVEALATLPRYIACSRVTKRPIFVFVDPGIRPNDALQVFALEDDWSFGVLQSSAHWAWFTARCSTLEERPRYTSNTVYDSFPWPQSPTFAQVSAVAQAGRAVRQTRALLQERHGWGLRDLYRTAEQPGKNPLRDAHAALDAAVAEAYGLRAKDVPLKALLDLNRLLAEHEANGALIVGPGLPPIVRDSSPFVTSDCIRMPTEGPTAPGAGPGTAPSAPAA